MFIFVSKLYNIRRNANLLLSFQDNVSNNNFIEHHRNLDKRNEIRKIIDRGISFKGTKSKGFEIVSARVDIFWVG